jgi:electron transport complex protein RnfG
MKRTMCTTFRKSPATLLFLLALLVFTALPRQASAHGAPVPAKTVSLATTPQVLRALFAQSDRVTFRKHPLTQQQREALTTRLGYSPPKGDYTIFIAFTGSQVDGYAVIDSAPGQVEPMTFAVKLSPQAVVQQVELMSHREPHGQDLAQRRFRQQFVGKTSRDELRVGQDIVIDPDASSAARAMAVGVRRALILVEELVLKHSPPGGLHEHEP